MASFCTKCGAEIPPGAQSCASCGTPVAAFTAVPVSAQPVVVAPAKSGSSALKIVLIILAVFLGLGILGAGAFGFFVWRIAHAVHVAADGNKGQFSLTTPGGNFSANTGETFSASDLGVDIYPGAQSGKGSFRMSTSTGSVITAVFLTPDSKDQVLTFYKTKMGPGGDFMDTGNSSVITINKSTQDAVVVTVVQGSGENQGKTQIQIMHTTSSKSS